MPLHSKSEFAVLCGIESRQISIYVNRKKLVLSGDFIDSTIEPNATFLRKKQAKGKKTTPAKNSPSNGKVTNVKKYKDPVFDEPGVPNVEDPEEADTEIREGDTLETQKLKHAIKKVKEDTLKVQLHNMQTMGKVIPTELVKTIFIQHNQSIVTEFKNGVEDIVRIVAKQKGMNVNEQAEITGEMVKIINTAIEKAIQLSIKNVDNITENYELQAAGN